MGTVYIEFRPNCRQRHVSCVEPRICGDVIRRPEPFALKFSPQSFGDVQMWAIWRQKEEEQSPFLPYRPKFPDKLPWMDACVIEHDKRVLSDGEREPVKEVGYFVSIDAARGGKAAIAVGAVYHTEEVVALASLIGYEDILTAELPAVRLVSLSADMALVPEIKVDESCFCLAFEFLQLLGLVRIELRRGIPLGTFPYTSISRASADKKALKVLSLASFHVDRCHASLAILTLCLSCSMALRTASSAEQSIMGLRLRPSRVSNPLIPSAWKRFIQALTEMWINSVCRPTSFEVNPWDFNRIARQRIRYA